MLTFRFSLNMDETLKEKEKEFLYVPVSKIELSIKVNKTINIIFILAINI